MDRNALPRTGGTDGTRRFVAVENGQVAGAATFNAAGGVLDWAIPENPAKDRIARALLEAGEEWVRGQGGSEVLLYSSPSSAPSEEAMRPLGFRPLKPPHVVMQVSHFPVFLQALADDRAEAFREWAPYTLLLKLERGLYPPLPEPEMLIRIAADGTKVEAGAGASDAVIQATATALSEFLFGATGLPEFLASGASVEPAAQKEKALRILGSLTIGRPWFVPLGERR